MALNNDQITAQNFKDFYGQIRPYLNGNSPICVNQFNKSDLYSTDEKMIGYWIDGKPLYEKTITGTTASASATDDVSIMTAQIGTGNDTVIIVSGYLVKDSSQFIPINFPWGLSDGTKTAVACFAQKFQITIKTVGYYAQCPFVVTIRYTKTAD